MTVDTVCFGRADSVTVDTVFFWEGVMVNRCLSVASLVRLVRIPNARQNVQRVPPLGGCDVPVPPAPYEGVDTHTVVRHIEGMK